MKGNIMFGWIGSFLVIGQMACLSLGLPTHFAIMVGMVASLCWLIHGLAIKDKPILFVNSAVMVTAIVGLIP
jgi:uncharacterized protein with PQ loop repeat